MPTVASPPTIPSTAQVTEPSLCAFATVAANCWCPLVASSVTAVGDTDTLIAAGGVTSAGHALSPAAAGADVDVLVDRIAISAESCRPASSVTVRRTVNEPVAGAFTEVVAVLFGPVSTPAPPTTSQK